MIAPGTRQLEHQRFHRMRIGSHQLDREIGHREQPDEHGEGERHQHALNDRRRANQPRDGTLRPVTQGKKASRHLQRGERSGEPQRGKAEFGDHSSPTVVSRAICAASCCSISCSSRGT